MSKILICGDLHFRENLRYSEYIPDNRKGEVKEVLDTIVKASSDCDKVVILGDCFDTKTNPNQVIRAFTEFIERFNGKEVFILAGNHSKSANGTTAIDYLAEIKNPKWHIITKTIEIYPNGQDKDKISHLVFMPYVYLQEVNKILHYREDVKSPENYQEASEAIVNALEISHVYKEKSILFVHQAISDSLTISGQSTNLFQEIVLPKSRLEKTFKRIIGGHIHKPQELGQTLVAGSVFTNEVGDTDKYVFKLDVETDKIEWIPLPVRPIIKLTNPALSDLTTLPRHCILKLHFTEKQPVSIEDYKEYAKCHSDAYLVSESYPSERKKLVDFHGDNIEFDIPTLLHLFAKQKNIDLDKLLSAWEEIKL